MANSKATKKALFMSIMSLLLCFTMLMGATFAWFTDAVTSANNRIQAGNLEIDLLMDKGENGNYETIADGEGDIFSEETGNGINWEPGKTEIVYLAVRNNGSLAIRYNILLDIVSEASAADKKPLAEALEYAIIDGAKAADVKALASNWETVKANATATGDLPTGQLVAAQGGILDEIVNGTAEETQYFALAIHMKEEAGNEYQNESVEIDVTVLATQKDAEEDSFGPDYDANAGESVDSPEALATAIAQGGTYKLASDMTLDSALTIPEGTTLTLNLNGKSITSTNGNAIKNAGTLTVANGTVSSVTTYAINNTGTANVNADIVGGIFNAGSLTVDGGSVTQNISYRHGVYHSGSTLIINDGEFESTVGNELIKAVSDNAVINGGTFKQTGKSYLFGDAGNLTINGGTFYGYVNADGTNDKMRPGVVASGGTFNFEPAVATGYVATDNGDGTWTVDVIPPVEVETSTELANALAEGGTVTVDASGVETTLSNIGTANQYGGTDSVIYDGLTVTGLTLSFEGPNQAFLTDGASTETGEIVFRDCTFKSSSFNTSMYFQSGANAENTKLIFENCFFYGCVQVADNNGGGVEFNGCAFNLNDDGFGYVQCMGGANDFNECTFNISASDTTYNTQMTKYGCLNTFSMNYNTVVNLNGCNSVVTNQYNYKGSATITENE